MPQTQSYRFLAYVRAKGGQCKIEDLSNVFVTDQARRSFVEQHEEYETVEVVESEIEITEYGREMLAKAEVEYYEK